MPLDVGAFDRRIAIQRYGLTRGPDNEPIEGWATLTTVWASATPVSDGEQARGAQVGAVITMRFHIHYSTVVADVDSKDRVVFNGKVYDVAGIKELGRREGLEISASAASDIEAAP